MACNALIRRCLWILWAVLALVSGSSVHAEEASKATARIVGGTASTSEYPWMVSIRLKNHASSHFCGGTLIASQWVLSAAHCFVDDDPSTVYEVVIGDLNRTTAAGSDVITVEKVYTHPKYNALLFKNDLALLKLSGSYTSSISLNLATASTISSALSVAGSVKALGWGYTSEGGPTIPEILREVDLDLIEWNTCNKTSNYASVDDSQVCAGVTGQIKDSCQGDSGGPLIYQSSTAWYQIGIVSWGVGCSGPGVYTDVSYFSNWISETIDGIAVTGHSIPSLHTDMGVIGVGETSTREITLVNNADSSVTLSSITLSGSSAFSLSENCPSALSAGDSCQFTVSLRSTSAVSHTTTVTIDSSANDVVFDLVGSTVQANAELSKAFKDNSFQWYTGGDLPWVLSDKIVDLSLTLEAGQVVDNGSSLLTTYFTGSGSVSYTVTSDITENEALLIYIDNELVDLYYGASASRTQSTNGNSITVESGEHQIIFAYISLESEKGSRLWLESFSFTGSGATSNTTSGGTSSTTATQTLVSGGGGGGGSLTWSWTFVWMLSACLRMIIRRNQIKG